MTAKGEASLMLKFHHFRPFLDVRIRKYQDQNKHSQILTLTPRKVVLDVGIRRIKMEKVKGGGRENSMKRLLLGRRGSSNEVAVNDSPPCHDVDNSDVSTLSHRIHTNDICLLCGEFGRKRELWYRCVISMGSRRMQCSKYCGRFQVRFLHITCMKH
jgi:hypothetical protein